MRVHFMYTISSFRQLLNKTLMAGGLALASTASHAQTVADIVKKGKVTIGVVSGVPPFGMADPQGNPVGYDVDVANLVAKYIGVPVEGPYKPDHYRY
jgi:polar amino acid transport system substrate-binding protein